MNKRLITCGRILRCCGTHRLSGVLQPSPNIRVIYTHEVKSDDIENLSQNLNYLLRERTALSPELFFKIMDNKCTLKTNSFLMTFDDGLVSGYQASKEILDPLGIKAVFFVPTAVLGLRNRGKMRRFAAEQVYRRSVKAASLTSEQYKFMTAEHLRDLVSRGHTVCPHTHNHVLLSDIQDNATAQSELINPKQILEELLDCRIRAFAFPVGTERQTGCFAYECVRRCYDFCFTALNGVNTAATDPYMLYRDCLPADAPQAYIQMVMEGTYDLYYRLKMNKLKKFSIQR